MDAPTPEPLTPIIQAAPARALLPDDAVSNQAVAGSPPLGKWVHVGVPKGVLPAFAPVRATLEPRVRDAYERAARRVFDTRPRCNLRWTLLAAIGAVESANGAHTSVSIVLTESGRILPPIIGPVLDSTAGTMAVRDTDGGVLDGDTVWDHAVGPMQFLPSTWARMGRDGNADGRSDPHSIDDASLTAAEYLCAGERDLSLATDLDAAIYSYNHSDAYVATVRAQLARFDVEFGLLPLVDEPGALALERSDGPAGSGTSPTSTSPALPTTSIRPPSSTIAPATTRGNTPSTTTAVTPTSTTAPVSTTSAAPASTTTLAPPTPTPTPTPTSTSTTPTPPVPA